jgi:hypothetical protein
MPLAKKSPDLFSIRQGDDIDRRQVKLAASFASPRPS